VVSGPKRHHQVPRFYLGRFAEKGRVHVRRRDGGQFTTDPINVAVEANFYKVSDVGPTAALAVEKMMSVNEGDAKTAMDQIDRIGAPPTEGNAFREVLTTFIGVQLLRTTQSREQVLFPMSVSKWAGGRALTERLMAEFLREQYLGFEPWPREAEAALTYIKVGLDDGPLNQDFAIRTTLSSLQRMLEEVLSFRWSVEAAASGHFITSDVPVVLWRPPSAADNYRGIGIANATEIRLPISPSMQIVLGRTKRRNSVRVTEHRVKRCNAEMAAGCHRFIVGQPSQIGAMSRLKLDARRPVLRFNIGPMVEDAPEGGLRQTGAEVLHVWHPRSPMSGRRN
jgi:hypothetical protein